MKARIAMNTSSSNQRAKTILACLNKEDEHNNIALKFQPMIDDKFWEIFGTEVENSSKIHRQIVWNDWLEKNNIKKINYSEDGSEYSKIREKYKIKVTDPHICAINTFANMYDEEYKLLLVPYDFVLKSIALGFLP